MAFGARIFCTTSAEVMPSKEKEAVHLVNIFVQDISNYGVNIAKVNEVLASKVKLFLVVFFQSMLL